ncbi:hypothetical protein B0T25DRAFT_618228 [Lasiosphaeria hispida]|uniref:Uncharacterized protein n=1 Tax=Lasiosphaeria hispida TaxID=260671 RepID=A0AAJ0H557_9PEZI|nr:hypothetical protein B0T25DRAFT_618228 [Lasiosphaeria hispida]
MPVSWVGFRPSLGSLHRSTTGRRSKAYCFTLFKDLSVDCQYANPLGRVLILPQLAFSLEAKIKRFFDNTPLPSLEEALKKHECAWMLKNISSLVSAPLPGLTNGLLTVAQGSHIKPENKTVERQGDRVVESVIPIKAAVFKQAGLMADRIGCIVMV